MGNEMKFELLGLGAILTVLYFMGKSKSAQANAPAAQRPILDFDISTLLRPLSAAPANVRPITRADTYTAVPYYLARDTPAYTPPSVVPIRAPLEVPYYLRRDTPAYPVAATDLPPVEQPLWMNSGQLVAPEYLLR